jgi:hypothetical protein
MNNEEKEYIKNKSKLSAPYGKVVYFEAIKEISTQISNILKNRVWGQINVHYNNFTDTLEVSISNRALNAEPFRYSHSDFSVDLMYKVDSKVLSQFILNEYREYLDMYFWRKYY